MTYHTRMNDQEMRNPFQTLGLPLAYDIDRDRVERAYRAKLSQAHPDAGGGDQPIDPATLNEARSAILDDERRAVRLLAVLGGPDASACRDLPDGFLMDMMMTRQEIEGAIESGGDAERAQWEAWGIAQRRAYRDRVSEMFMSLGSDPDAEELRDIRVQLNAWRYIERLIEQLDPDYDPAQADFS